MPDDALPVGALPEPVEPPTRRDTELPEPANDQGGPPAAPTQALPTVRDLRVGGADERGNTVKYIYVRDPDYVVYYSRLEHAPPDKADGSAASAWRRWRRFGRHTAGPVLDTAYESEGVQAQLSSVPDKRQAQRAKLLPLGIERAKLQALLSGWPRRQSYDSSIATALQLALDGNGDGASAKNALDTISDARASILNEREVAGRAQYVRLTLLFGLTGFLLLVLAQVAAENDSTVWQGAEAGLLGAILSIAIGLRKRSVALDIGLKGNLSDCLLRLITGAVSGLTVVLLFSTGIVPPMHTLHGDLDVTKSASFAMLLGIIAGFVEKLVPNLLEDEAQRLSDGGGAKAQTADGGGKADGSGKADGGERKA